MKYVLKNQEMQTVDYETIHGIGIPGLVLMERASKAVADCAAQMINHSKRILVISGIGNNGGDALACTRILLEQDYQVDYMIVGNLEKASDDLKLQLQILKNLGYFPLEKLRELTSHCSFCSACFDGCYPTAIPDDTRKDRFEKRLSDIKESSK